MHRIDTLAGRFGNRAEVSDPRGFVRPFLLKRDWTAIRVVPTVRVAVGKMPAVFAEQLVGGTKMMPGGTLDSGVLRSRLS